METDWDSRVTEIKDEIEQGCYRVDPQAVADAILRRLRELAYEGVAATAVAATPVAVGSAQNECS